MNRAAVNKGVNTRVDWTVAVSPRLFRRLLIKVSIQSLALLAFLTSVFRRKFIRCVWCLLVGLASPTHCWFLVSGCVFIFLCEPSLRARLERGYQHTRAHMEEGAGRFPSLPHDDGEIWWGEDTNLSGHGGCLVFLKYCQPPQPLPSLSDPRATAALETRCRRYHCHWTKGLHPHQPPVRYLGVLPPWVTVSSLATSGTHPTLRECLSFRSVLTAVSLLVLLRRDFS